MIRRDSILVTRYITYLDRLVPRFGSHCHADKGWNRQHGRIPDNSRTKCSTEKTSEQDETVSVRDSAYQLLQGNLYARCFEFLVRQYQHYHAIHPSLYDRDRDWQCHLTLETVQVWQEYFLKQFTRSCRSWEFDFCSKKRRAARPEQHWEFEEYSEFSEVIPEQEEHPETCPMAAHRFGQQPDQKAGNLRIPVSNSGAVGLSPVGSVSLPLTQR